MNLIVDCFSTYMYTFVEMPPKRQIASDRTGHCVETGQDKGRGPARPP